MKKSLKGLIIASLLLTGSSIMASTDSLSYKVGGATTSIGGANTSTGLSFGMEFSFLGSARVREDDKYDVYLDFGISSFKGGNINKTMVGARYEIKPKIWLGGSIGLGGTSGFMGLMYGGHAKYEFTQNHGAILEYRIASMGDMSGLSNNVNASVLSLEYCYSF